MSKKRLVTLILSIGIFLSLAATVFAAGQPRRYNENSTVKGTISQSFYQVNAKTDVAVKRITVTGTLYEKGTFGTWQKVSSCSNTSTSSSCSASSNYNTKPGRSYRLECSATYTINNFVGRMVDLIALVVGALTLPNIVAEAFLDALIKGLGITVASGMIKNAVTDTVSCIKTQYTWNLVDTTAASHQKNVYGYKYYITDVKSAAKNNNYYEGYVPKDWKTQSLAVNFHNEMFTYNAWNVVGWA